MRGRGGTGGGRKLCVHTGYAVDRLAEDLRPLGVIAEFRRLWDLEWTSSEEFVECIEAGRIAPFLSSVGCPVTLGALELPDEEWGGLPGLDDSLRETGGES